MVKKLKIHARVRPRKDCRSRVSSSQRQTIYRAPMKDLCPRVDFRAARDLSASWLALRFASSVLFRLSLKPISARTSDPSSYPSISNPSQNTSTSAAGRSRILVFGAQSQAKEATPEGKSKKAGRRRSGWGAPIPLAGLADAPVLGKSDEEETLRRACDTAKQLMVSLGGFLTSLGTHCTVHINEPWQEFVGKAKVRPVASVSLCRVGVMQLSSCASWGLLVAQRPSSKCFQHLHVIHVWRERSSSSSLSNFRRPATWMTLSRPTMSTSRGCWTTSFSPRSVTP